MNEIPTHLQQMFLPNDAENWVCLAKAKIMLAYNPGKTSFSAHFKIETK